MALIWNTSTSDCSSDTPVIVNFSVKLANLDTTAVFLVLLE